MTHPSQPLCHVADCGRPTQGFLCNGHAQRLERLLAEIPAQLKELAVNTARQSRVSRGDSGKATKAAAQPLPIDLRTAHLADLVRNGLASWIRHITETHGLDCPTIKRTEDMALWLLEAIDSIRQDELAAECLTAITNLSRALNSAVDNHGRRFAGLCTTRLLPGDPIATRDEYGQEVITFVTVERECGEPLHVREGADRMTCRFCEREYTTAERMAWILAKTRDKLETAAGIAEILTSTRQYGKVTASVIYNMEARGLIAFVTWDEFDRKIYRIGDIVAVLDARAALRTERRGRMSA